MHLPHPLGEACIGPRLHPGLHEGAIETEIDLGEARDRRELALVIKTVDAKGANVVEGSRLEANEIITANQVVVAWTGCLLRRDYCLVKARRQNVDEVDVAGELIVLLLRYRAGDKDAEMSDQLMHGIDDGLPVGADVVDAAVKVEDPIERLRGRRNVVGLGAEHDDRRADATQIHALAVRRHNPGSRELVADEQLIGDELHLLGVEEDMPAPPFLEFKVAGSFGVDLGIEIVLLGPIRVGRVEILEIADEPGPVEFAGPEIAHHCREPSASEQAAGIAHGIFAVHAGPIGQRRAGNDDRTKKLGPLGGDHHHCPACLAIADDCGLAVGFGVERDDSLEKGRLGRR